MMRLIVLRHGLTTFNAEGRMQGHLDTPLTDTGHRQAAAAAAALADRGIDEIYASDLSRAFDTARALSEATGIEVIADERLRETHLGSWQGRTRVDIDDEFPGARGRWREDPTWAPEGAETQREVGRRGRGFIEELLGRHDPSQNLTVAVVTHGGWSAALVCSLLGFTDEQVAGLGRLNNCCWGELTATASTDGGYRWCLQAWNLSA